MFGGLLGEGELKASDQPPLLLLLLLFLHECGQGAEVNLMKGGGGHVWDRGRRGAVTSGVSLSGGQTGA